MPTFKFNFDEIPDSVPPEGEVEAVIDKVVMKLGKDSGQPYLNWQFTIVEGDYTNQKVWMITSLSEKALFRLRDVFKGLGFTDMVELVIDEDENEQGEQLLIEPELEGVPVTLKISHREYQGRKQASVDEILDYHTTAHLEGYDIDAGVEDEDEEEWEEAE